MCLSMHHLNLQACGSVPDNYFFVVFREISLLMTQAKVDNDIHTIDKEAEQAILEIKQSTPNTVYKVKKAYMFAGE